MLEQAVRRHRSALPALLDGEDFHTLQGSDQEKAAVLCAVTRDTWLVPRARLTVNQLAELTRK